MNDSNPHDVTQDLQVNPLPHDNAAPSEHPERIGRYRIEKVLGKGGFGLVYLAHDEQLNRPVAIKVPHAKLISRPDDAEAYLAEARTVANLDHPGIVPVFDVGSTKDCPCYVVSKYIQGTDLATTLKQKRLSYHEAAELVATVADALHYAHKQGLVHRDVKPGNILIGIDGKPYVVDFGLALREENIGKGPKYAGTPAYMSPEQARGEGHRVDGRSDIFSLGIVFYELLTGRQPFRGNAQAELFEQVTSYEAKPLRQYDENIPKELERICHKAMAKRASERYSIARDFSDDLRHFLAEPTVIPSGTLPGEVTAVIAGTHTSKGTSTPVGSIAASSASVNLGSSDNQPIKIVPKGLRSFDAPDADFFVELLPGPRDREGLPDSLRFWKTRIEETDPDNTFSVGLIYGPSGCGKSSLVKAGLLPRLSEGVISVYVEATPEETETRLLHGLRKRCPALEDNLSLNDTLAELRRGHGIPVGKKVLIVLDQFEQWLHAKKEEENSDLVQALRQCDGGRVQCIVMVRDDFWLAVSRFLRELEVRLLEGQNIALVDLFDLDHARKVLAAFGRAFGKLPENVGDTTKEQEDFLTQSVAGLAEEGKVICVRLALFAEMMKVKPWTPATLKEVGGTKGVGVTFLEETFSSSSASPEHRYHQKAARAVLKDLLPFSGTDIKGTMRSYAELLEASGYGGRPKDFDDLIRILDREIRLVTPTDPEGKDAGNDSVTPSHASQKYFQLTHDYLVHSLRDWLTRKQKETRKGRAELKLFDTSVTWNSKPENRFLPSLWDHLAIRLLTDKRKWTESQRRMMGKAGRVHAVRWGSFSAILILTGFTIWTAVANERRTSLRRQAVTAVDAVQNNRGLAVPFTLRDLNRLPREFVIAELKARYPNADMRHKLGLAFALADYGEPDVPFICSQIGGSPPEEVDNLVTALRRTRDASRESITGLAEAAEAEQNWRRKARLAVIALQLGDNRLAADMCRIVGRPDPIQRTIFIDEFSKWHGNVAMLAQPSRTGDDEALRSGLCLALGSIASDRLSDAETEAWTPLFMEWFQLTPDNVTHSAAGWALRQWGITVPTLLATSQPVEGRQWFVNSLGMTLLKIEPGVFVRKDSHAENRVQTVKLTRAFFLCGQEVSSGQFQQFIDDPDCPIEVKQEQDRIRRPSIDPPTADQPAEWVSWFEAIVFCNWLSRKEGRTPCYEPFKTTVQTRRPPLYDRIVDVEVEDWQLVPGRSGYRLPTEAEWEHACRAGTVTDFASGSDEELLRRYAVCNCNRSLPCGSRMPNGWGLFDMHGNVWEWCHDRWKPYASDKAIDPITGPTEAWNRAARGGDWEKSAVFLHAGFRASHDPGTRQSVIGFRLALSPSGGTPEAVPVEGAEKSGEGKEGATGEMR